MSKANIFIIEDEALIADHIALCLEDEGYAVAGMADSGQEALAQLEALRPDLCLIDIHLAGALDGVDVAQEINRRFQIPFIFVTSNTDNRTLERVKITQPAGFIVKPYTQQDLATNVKIALYKQQIQKIEPEPEPNPDHAKGTPSGETGNQEPATSAQEPTNNALSDSFFVKDKHQLIRLRYRDILYAEAMDNYTRLHTERGNFMLSQTLKSVESRLLDFGFIRIHRSYLANLLHVDLIAPRHLMIGKKELPVSESQRQKLLELIRMF